MITTSAGGSVGGGFRETCARRSIRDARHLDAVQALAAFGERGKILIERQDMKTNRTETRKASADPAPNWERYPEFGCYALLLCEERAPVS
ncbi:MAG TPA: hypothetical protein VFT55_00715 [Planctomycetota bacterium]|nr:hypothetical protein [Planctomycetota bacterium]